MYPALALIEVSSIAKGMVVTDRCVKKADVKLLASNPVSPGRYITLFWGGVAEVEEAFLEGVSIAAETLVDKLFLPGTHNALLDTLLRIASPPPTDSLAIIETHTVASALWSADAACKAGEVHLLELRLGSGLAGKGYYVLSGSLDQVEAAVDGAIAVLPASLLVAREIIPAPASDFTEFVW